MELTLYILHGFFKVKQNGGYQLMVEDISTFFQHAVLCRKADMIFTRAENISDNT